MISYTLNEYGLRQKDMDYMLQLFETIPAIEQVILYGSRATGSFEAGSDIDLAVFGPKVTYGNIAHVHDMLEEESPTLLWFDVVHYDRLRNDNLKAEIDEKGKVIYKV